MNDSMAVVNRDSGRVLIEGVPELAWGKSGECTFVGALAAASSVTEYPCDYATVMVATGLAFRVRWFQGHGEKHWCPSSPVGEQSEEIEAARKATGWTLKEEWDWHNPLDRFKGEIVASIDAGLPVLAYDATLNVGVICGYEENGQKVLFMGYGSGPTPLAVPLIDIKAMLIFLGSHTPSLSKHEAAIQGIRLGVDNWKRRHDPPSDDEHGYWYGEAALKRWHNDLTNYAHFSDKQRVTLFFVSWWCYDSLADARNAAATFFQEAQSLFVDEAGEDIATAMATYQRASQMLQVAFVDKDAFLGPWSGKAIKDWTDDVRAREQEILTSMRRFDSAGIAAIEKIVYSGE